MTGKCWGYLYGIAWTVFIPVILTQRRWPFRAVAALLLASCIISLIAWTQYTLRTVPWDKHDVMRLEGTGPFRWDVTKARLLQIVAGMKNKILLTGKSGWAFCAGPPLANFTDNETYITWSYISGEVFCSKTHHEGDRRERLVNDFYDGKCEDPVPFLRNRNIFAVVIWPDDNIGNDVLVKLKYQLSGYYDYNDCGQRSGSNAGVFVRNPYIDLLPYPAYLYR